MSRIARTALLAISLAATSILPAQSVPPTVRTFPLRYLSSEDAANLVAPYVRPFGDVFDAGKALRGITVRGEAKVLAVVDSILRANDREAPVLMLRFQLIAADNTPGRDPAIENVDASLRALFKFTGYHLLSEGAAMATSHSSFLLDLAAGNHRYELSGEVSGFVTDAKGTVQMHITLSPAAIRLADGKFERTPPILRTALSVPIGHTMVVGGTAATARIEFPGGANREVQALILTVRPEIAPQKP